MTQTAHLATRQASADLYVEIQDFYARQLPLLEERDFEAFAGTFTEDCDFKYSAAPQVNGREELVAGMYATVPRAYGNSVFRHWFGHVRIEPGQDGTIQVTARAIVSVTAEDGSVTFEPSCTVEDVFVRQDGVLRVKSRVIRHDLTDVAGYWARRAAAAASG